MTKRNFKVICVETNDCNFYTKGKTYEIVDGILVCDDGDVVFENLIYFKNLQESSDSVWQLVE